MAVLAVMAAAVLILIVFARLVLPRFEAKKYQELWSALAISDAGVLGLDWRSGPQEIVERFRQLGWSSRQDAWGAAGVNSIAGIQCFVSIAHIEGEKSLGALVMPPGRWRRMERFLTKKLGEPTANMDAGALGRFLGWSVGNVEVRLIAASGQPALNLKRRFGSADQYLSIIVREADGSISTDASAQAMCENYRRVHPHGVVLFRRTAEQFRQDYDRRIIEVVEFAWFNFCAYLALLSCGLSPAESSAVAQQALAIWTRGRGETAQRDNETAVHVFNQLGMNLHARRENSQDELGASLFSAHAIMDPVLGDDFGGQGALQMAFSLDLDTSNVAGRLKRASMGVDGV